MTIRFRVSSHPFAYLLCGGGMLMIAVAGFLWFSGSWEEQQDRERYLAEIAAPGVVEAAGPLPKGNPAPHHKVSTRPAAASALGLGVIDIPRLKLTSLIRPTDEDRDLSRGVGHVRGTAFPGQAGTVALAGHRDTFFRDLRWIRDGDTIRLRLPGGTKLYQVKETKVVEPTDVSVLHGNNRDRLVLITCFPFHYIGPAPHRFIVIAEPIPHQIARR
ncbi:class D sortase [Bryobacter aggregatus]|uniref:class D sortase n=1 Tax=Bryobacter aggregatus TaxID=360054 RepID=UPI000691D2C6|nr:class D sortase [Bryobacter aggregatus]